MKLIAAATAAGFVAVGDCRSLRTAADSSEQSLALVSDDPASNKEIHEKWDKMDEFLNVMFGIACKWKHGKDVDGLAAEKLKDGDLHPKEVTAFKGKTMDTNVMHMRQSCGKLSGDGKAACRQSCSDRWNKVMTKRSDCDAKCVSVYDSFKKSCAGKADNLAEVYSMAMDNSAAKKQCYNGFCGKFPTVWLKSKTEDMTTEREKQCKERICSEDAIAVSCRRKWQLEVDFKAGDIARECFDDGKVKECFAEKKGTAGEDQTKCSDDGKKKCSDSFDECNTKGKTDNTFKEGAEFCDKRKKMCEDQVVDNCHGDHEKALDTAQKACEKADVEAGKECKTKKLKEAEDKATDTCKADLKVSCPADCSKKCQVDKLDKCLGNLKTEDDPTEMFCMDFWQLIHSSSDVDPVTGNPIVLLSP